MGIENSYNEILLPRTGKVYSFTTLTDPSFAPSRFEKQVPYVVAIVELENGIKITAQLTDLQREYEKKTVGGEERKVLTFPQLRIGMPVEMVTRKLFSDGDEDRGSNVYGYKFRPPVQSENP